MLLAIDIGNTTITFGVFKGEELVVTWRVVTAMHRTPDEYAAVLLNLMSHRGLSAADIDGVVLCNVVPPVMSTFENLLDRYFNITPLVVGAGIKTGVRIRVDNPREVGADRIVNVAAAHHLYGGPVIVVDLGTATTFDAVSEEGDYLGGAIAPGIAISAEALFMRAAKLPRVELVRPKRAIGTNTIAAMQSGIVFGYVGLIESVVTHIKQELRGDVKVVATGGLSSLITSETPVFDIINVDLTLIGLRLIYLMNKTMS